MASGTVAPTSHSQRKRAASICSGYYKLLQMKSRFCAEQDIVRCCGYKISLEFNVLPFSSNVARPPRKILRAQSRHRSLNL